MGHKGYREHTKEKHVKPTCTTCGQEEGYCDSVKAKQAEKKAAKKLEPSRSTISHFLMTKLNEFETYLSDCISYDSIETYELEQLSKKTAELNKLVRKTFYVPSVGDEVSLRVDGAGVTSYEDAIISRIDGNKVFIHDNDNAYDIKTGRDLNLKELPSLGFRISLVYDHGWEAQHYEDVCLGEGDTL